MVSPALRFIVPARGETPHRAAEHGRAARAAAGTAGSSGAPPGRDLLTRCLVVNSLSSGVHWSPPQSWRYVGDGVANAAITPPVAGVSGPTGARTTFRPRSTRARVPGAHAFRLVGRRAGWSSQSPGAGTRPPGMPDRGRRACTRRLAPSRHPPPARQHSLNPPATRSPARFPNPMSNPRLTEKTLSGVACSLFFLCTEPVFRQVLSVVAFPQTNSQSSHGSSHSENLYQRWPKEPQAMCHMPYATDS